MTTITIQATSVETFECEMEVPDGLEGAELEEYIQEHIYDTNWNTEDQEITIDQVN